MGALDYLVKPLQVAEVRRVVERALEVRRMVNSPVVMGTAAGPGGGEGDVIIGRSPAMQEVYKAIGLVASQNVTVLIRGESGTGKELVARALYQFSKRSKGPFLAVNCAAIPETLLESELFGHEKGAFTGADRRRIGKFEQCNGGTLFLDEIGDMPPLLQSKLLRVLQEKQFQRVGGEQVITTDVRVLAATNRDLEAWWPTTSFAKTCSIGSTATPSTCRRCGNGATTWICWSTTFGVRRTGTWTRTCWESRPKPCSCCGTIPGPATCEKCRT